MQQAIPDATLRGVGDALTAPVMRLGNFVRVRLHHHRLRKLAHTSAIPQQGLIG